MMIYIILPHNISKYDQKNHFNQTQNFFFNKYEYTLNIKSANDSDE